MGQTGCMEKADTQKESAWARPSEKLDLAWASSCMQGWRPSMEDNHICLPALGGSNPHWRDIAMFGVLDGHGGEQVANFGERHLPEEIKAYPLKAPPTKDDFRCALTRAFNRIDECLRETKTLAELQTLSNEPKRGSYPPQRMNPNPDPRYVGATCCICLITEDHFVIGNAGDSRAVLCRGGQAVALSEDHKPTDPGEKQRIVKAHGWVEEIRHQTGTQYRVNGNLNLSRALGDLEYKKDRTIGPEAQIISGCPDVEFFSRTPQDEFIVICCDGVWDVKTNQEVVNFVRGRLPEKPSGNAEADAQASKNALEALLDSCVSPNLQMTKGLGGDNMTSVVVRLPKMSSKPEAAPKAAMFPRYRLCNVSSRASKPGASDGILLVRLAIDGASQDMPCAADVECWLHESSTELQVSLRNANASCNDAAQARFPLAEHLPPGSRLVTSACRDGRLSWRDIVCVKIHKRSGALSVRLPWRSD